MRDDVPAWPQRAVSSASVGRSASGTLGRRRNASASGSLSWSSHFDDNRLRERTSSSLRALMSKRDPTGVSPEPMRVSLECRTRTARRINSLSSSFWYVIAWTCSTGIRRVRPGAVKLKLGFECPKKRLRRFAVGPFLEELKRILGAAVGGEASGKGDPRPAAWALPAPPGPTRAARSWTHQLSGRSRAHVPAGCQATLALHHLAASAPGTDRRSPFRAVADCAPAQQRRPCGRD